MKIVVINYDEINKRKTLDGVVCDVLSFFASCEDAVREELGSKLRLQLEKLGKYKRAEVKFADTSDSMKRLYLTEKLKKMDIDLLVTYNLAGFELCTLTDGLAYNLVDCRQLHFISKNGLANEKFLDKDKSINMFFWKLYE